MPDGYLALVLHGHLPYIYHPEKNDVLEERWIFEALTECYLPLLEVLETLVADEIDFRITLSLSPTLLSMLADETLQERYCKYLQNTIRLARLEQERLAASAEFKALADFYYNKLSGILNCYEKYQRNIINPIKLFQQKGKLEVITTCATHGYLPLMKNQISRRAQVEAAIDEYYRHFGCMPKGIWLPECGYAPGVDKILRDCGLKYFFIDTHGIANSSPVPVYGVFAPVCTHTGVAAFGRDPDSSRQVWDRNQGYPGDSVYREFYRDIGYDLEIDYIGDFLPGGKYRVDTGLKYYRITGKGVEKEPYNPEIAVRKTAEHARDFVARRRRQVQEAADMMQRRPVIVAPYDAELFGHWWFEGPMWINYVCRETAGDNNSVKLATPTDYLLEYPQNQSVDIPMCSWGAGGYNQHWLNPSTDWMYKHLHIAEDRMSELADSNPRAAGVEKRCLNQCARELLLAQSSDWPFIVYEGTTVDYAKTRFRNHIGRFNALADMLESGIHDLNMLQEIEVRTNFLPNIDYKVYCSNKYIKRPSGIKKSYRVMMLSWEYPPKTVGGLARHVHDLACALTAMGDEVHVITCPADGRDVFSLDQGVYVHRAHPGKLSAEKFIDWVKQLNAAMLDMSGMLAEVFGSFDLVHAHDWLVSEAAGLISDRYNLPVVATIHATEHGRNHGLHNDLQRHIHGLEAEFAKRSDFIICCSNYMEHEIASLFDRPHSKIRVIPNGVELENIQSGIGQMSNREDGKTIVFLGRLVPEKGVQVLISALPGIIETVGAVRLVIAGKGPYQGELEKLAADIGVGEYVDFIGFVDDESRNRLLSRAAVAVFPSLYEPFGIVALEAMAAGVSVIVSDTGGLRDIIEHGIDGYLTPPGNVEILGYYVSELIRHPELAQHFSKRAGRNVFVKFNWKQIAVETLGVYAEAVTNSRR